jgi:perosamine synthetase
MIPVAKSDISLRDVQLVHDAVESGWVSSIGPYIERFEKNFAKFNETEFAIAVSNGTTALHLALHAIGIKPGDEVIVPDLTFVATVNVIIQCGATPVLVDVNPSDWCLDTELVERAINTRTRAIIPVHLYGQPANVGELVRIVEGKNIHIVEDAAEAHGARLNGKRVGGLGTIGAFSFYGNKIITTGEGGIITTNDEELANRIRFLKDHGMSPTRRYFHTEVAFNYRMTNIQAALGVAQLERIEQFIAQRETTLRKYRDLLLPLDMFEWQQDFPERRSVCWLVSALMAGKFERYRDEFITKLRNEGVDSRPFFVPMSKLPYLSSCLLHKKNHNVSVAEQLSLRGLNLPTGTHVSDSVIVRISEVIRRVSQTLGK